MQVCLVPHFDLVKGNDNVSLGQALFHGRVELLVFHPDVDEGVLRGTTRRKGFVSQCHGVGTLLSIVANSEQIGLQPGKRSIGSLEGLDGVCGLGLHRVLREAGTACQKSPVKLVFFPKL